MEWKNKRLPVEEIPFSWSVKDFKEVFKVNQGLQIPIAKREKVSTNTNHFYLTNEFINNRHNGGDNYYIENPPPNVVCSSDDILMTRTGNTGIVVTNVDGAFHNNFFKIKYDKNELHKNFVYYYLKSSYVQKMIRIYAGSSTIPDLNHSDFYKIKLLKPSYIEQKTISEIIYTWDKAIKLKQQLIDLKKEQKKGLMQKLLTGKVRSSKFDSQWKSQKLSRYLRESKIKSSSEDTSNRLTVRLHLKGVTQREVKPIEKQGATTQYIRKAGQLIYGKQNLHNGALGLVPDELNGYESSSDIPSFDINDNLNSYFLYYYLSRCSYYKSLEKIATGTGSKRIKPDDFLAISIRVPEYEEQKYIADLLLTFDKNIEAYQKELKALKEQKKGLMQQLLTGKTRVKV